MPTETPGYRARNNVDERVRARTHSPVQDDVHARRAQMFLMLLKCMSSSVSGAYAEHERPRVEHKCPRARLTRCAYTFFERTFVKKRRMVAFSQKRLADSIAENIHN